MMLTFQNMRGNASLGASTDAPAMRGWGDKSPRSSNSDHLAMGSLVGQREGRLSESLSADRRQAAHADIQVSVQDKPLSHSFPTGPAFERSQFTQAILDVLALASGLLLITAAGVSITVSVFFLFFCSF